jgi:hypothetical protein
MTVVTRHITLKTLRRHDECNGYLMSTEIWFTWTDYGRLDPMSSKLRYKKLPIRGDTMLSDEQLQRIGDSYRRGYQDGYAGRKKRKTGTRSHHLDSTLGGLASALSLASITPKATKPARMTQDGITKQLQVSDCVLYIRKS